MNSINVVCTVHACLYVICMSVCNACVAALQMGWVIYIDCPDHLGHFLCGFDPNLLIYLVWIKTAKLTSALNTTMKDQ